MPETVPQGEAIHISAEFGIHIVLHLVVVTVQMIRRDVHQYGNVGTTSVGGLEESEQETD